MQEVRDIASMEGIKGKHFFLEADIKGPALKLDNTGKSILTVSIIYFLSTCAFDKGKLNLVLLLNLFEALNWITTSIQNDVSILDDHSHYHCLAYFFLPIAQCAYMK